MLRPLLAICIVLPLQLLVVRSAENESKEFAERLNALEDAMKSEVDALKQKISGLEHELKELKGHSNAEHKRQVNSNGIEVAFSATVDSDLTNLPANHAIVFSSVMTNIGNHYNPNSGVFHVDVPGTYLLFANILSEAGHSIETEIVMDGSSVSEIYSGGTDFFGSGSNLVILDLQKGQDVWVKVHDHFSTNMGVHCCWSSFSGYLLRHAGASEIIG